MGNASKDVNTAVPDEGAARTLQRLQGADQRLTLEGVEPSVLLCPAFEHRCQPKTAAGSGRARAFMQVSVEEEPLAVIAVSPVRLTGCGRRPIGAKIAAFWGI